MSSYFTESIPLTGSASEVSADAPGRNWQSLRTAGCAAALVLADGLAMVAAYVLGDAAAHLGHPDLSRSVVPVALLALGLFAVAQVYPGYGLQRREILRRRVAVTAVAGVAVLALSVDGGAPVEPIATGLLMVLWLALQLMFSAATRLALRALGIWGVPVSLSASPENFSRITEFLDRNWDYGYKPAAGLPGGAAARIIMIDQFPVREQVPELAASFDSAIVMADTQKMQISGLQPLCLNGKIGLHLRLTRRRSGWPIAKRVADLVLAAIGLVIASPVLVLCAAAIWLVDPGPVFYRQQREGYRGRPIRVWKLRTMYRDADRLLDELLARDADARREWETHFKLRNDPRILPVVGAFLRSSSFDELPQLFNILMGEMSIVGPRPFPGYHLDAMTPEMRRRRCSVAPGLTGLWQISERSGADIELQCQLDMYYVENRSFWLDCLIIVGTFAAVLRRSGT